MFNIFKKKKEESKDEDIVILSRTKPYECGGTDATLDRKAPKTIVSKEITSFSVESALPRDFARINRYDNTVEFIGYVMTFAVPVENGTFMYLVTSRGFYHGEERKSSWAFIKENVLPQLAELVEKQDIAKENGYHSTTHGLPENFGGSVLIKYASGEKISFSDNQGPIISSETGLAIAEFFKTAMGGEKIDMPDVSKIKMIKFAEERGNGGFSHAVLTLNPDGTAVNERTDKYDSEKIYERKKDVSAETVREIKKNIEEFGILGWTTFPQRSYISGNDKKLTFIFDDGSEITVDDIRDLPSELSRGFFNIELEMTTKN